MHDPALPPGYRDRPPASWHSDSPADAEEAEQFLRLCYLENPQPGDIERRVRQVRAEIADTGTYTHTGAELAHGARVAWRNSPRCIGRAYWRALQVLDCRDARTADDVYQQAVRHLRVANGDRKRRSARPVMSVFPPAGPGRPTPPRIWNEQLIRYAGDPQYARFAAAMRELGWTGPGGRFDLLPLAIETVEDGPRLFQLPAEVVLQVLLTHPDYDWFAGLAIRWHAVPAISHMRLRLGGVDYPLCMFNGWYLDTEIGTRNLADPHRYDLAPVVADRLGLDMSRESTLWRDRAILEICRAVLHSFRAARVAISDHHTEATRFLRHIDRERTQGRITAADWTWIVGAAGTNAPVFHHYYPEADLRPNLYLDPAAARLARTGDPTGSAAPPAVPR